MPLPLIRRSDLWVADLGYVAKVRPVVIASIPFLEHERRLCIVVPHTTSRVGTRFEIAIEHRALDEGVFDVQQTAAVQAVKLIHLLGHLDAKQMEQIDRGLMFVLGLGGAGNGYFTCGINLLRCKRKREND